MVVLKVFSWICYIAGAIALLVGLADNLSALITAGVTLLISGVFYQAFDYGLVLLKDIRDSLSTKSSEALVGPLKDSFKSSSDENIKSEIKSQEQINRERLPVESVADLKAHLNALSDKLAKK